MLWNWEPLGPLQGEGGGGLTELRVSIDDLARHPEPRHFSILLFALQAVGPYLKFFR